MANVEFDFENIVLPRKPYQSKGGLAWALKIKSLTEIKYNNHKSNIIDLYAAGATLNQIALSVPKSTRGAICKWLKIWGVFDKNRIPKQKTKGYTGHIKPPTGDELTMRAHKLMAESLRLELRFAQLTDDHRHWFRHPTCRNHYAWLRIKKSPYHRMTKALRCRIYKTVIKQGYTKSAKTLKLLGCSINQVKRHLEKNFAPGMGWHNYGKWEIDHIKPCSSFDLENASEQLKCFNWTNLQPLWKRDNIAKGGCNRFKTIKGISYYFAPSKDF